MRSYCYLPNQASYRHPRQVNTCQTWFYEAQRALNTLHFAGAHGFSRLISEAHNGWSF